MVVGRPLTAASNQELEVCRERATSGRGPFFLAPVQRPAGAVLEAENARLVLAVV